MDGPMPSSTSKGTNNVGGSNAPPTVTKTRTSTPLRMLVDNFVSAESPATPEVRWSLSTLEC